MNLKPTAYTVRMPIPKGERSPNLFKLPDGITYISTTVVNLLTNVGEPCSAAFIIGTLDGSPLTSVSLELLNNASRGISFDTFEISSSEMGVAINFTATEVAKFDSILRVSFPILNFTTDVILGSQAILAPSSIGVSPNVLDFGTLVEPLNIFREINITTPDNHLDPKMLQYVLVSGTESDAASFYFNFLDASVDALGNITLSVWYVPRYSVSSDITVQMYYGADPIGSPIQVLGNTTLDITTTIPWALRTLSGVPPDGTTQIAVSYINFGSTSFRIGAISVLQDTLAEFTINDLPITIGTVLYPREVIWILITYEPKQATLSYPTLQITGVYF